MRDDDDVSARREGQPITFETTRQIPTRIGDIFFVYFLLNGVEQPFFDMT
jgi:hypothetical protein